MVRGEEDNMFHIANKFYLEYDYAFTNTYPYLVASSTWGTRNFVNIDLSAPISAVSFDDMITNEFDGDREQFWTTMIAKDAKFVAYLDPDTITALQVQYWRSIFDNISVEDVHRLHNAWIDSEKLANSFLPIGNYDADTSSWNRSNAINSLSYKTLAEITTIYNDNTASAVLQGLNKNNVSFEYLLADYYNDNSSPYAAKFLERVGYIAWDNWLDEINHLRYELVSLGLDIDAIDTDLTTSPGSLISQIESSADLSWILDPQYEDLDYFKANYDHTKAMAAYETYATASGIDWETNHLSTLSTNIVAGNWTTVLTNDINKGTGSMFTKERFAGKMNSVFVSWVYKMVRAGTTANLSGYQLKR